VIVLKLANSQEMREIDYQAINDFGIPSLVLMENAGIRTVEVIKELLPEGKGKKVIVLAGKGNNGGDGLVIARHLINSGIKVETFLMAFPEEISPDSLTNYRILERISTDIYQLQEEKDLEQLMLSLLSADLVVDAIYGNGFHGRMNDFESRVARMVNCRNLPVVAVDVPSGIEADTGKVNGEAIKATHTVSFALPKVGLVLEPGRDFTGILKVVDISIPEVLLKDKKLKKNLIEEEMIKPLIKPRLAESHKGSYGHVLVIGGSPGLTGAVIMTAYSALRIGAGLVTAALPESLLLLPAPHGS
jgi:hydroxyethylthiazole kinase-like uncharacterized protein yjeF